MSLSGPVLHRFFVRAALSGAHLFAWIFVFQYFYLELHSVSRALVSVLFTYALTHVVVVLLTPITAKRMRNGFKRTLIIATLLLAGSFAVLAAAMSGQLGDIALGVSLFALLTGVYRAFYWIPYELSQAATSAPHREWMEIAIALLPLAAGLWLTSGDAAPMRLLYGAAALSFVSTLLLSKVRDVHEGFAWRYRESFHELFDSRNRSLLWSSTLSGIEATALFILWPIAVFTLVDWSYPLLGAVLSLTLIFSLIARKLFAPAIYAVPVRVQPLLAASGWIMRLGVSGFVGAILIDTYFHTASRASARGHDTTTFEHVADNRTFVDEYTALKEMGMAIGRIALCIVAAVLLSIFALPHAVALTLVVAALAAGFSVYHSHREQKAY